MQCIDLHGFTLICTDLNWFTLICTDLRWFAQICIDLHWFTLVYTDLLWFALHHEIRTRHRGFVSIQLSLALKHHRKTQCIRWYNCIQYICIDTIVSNTKQVYWILELICAKASSKMQWIRYYNCIQCITTFASSSQLHPILQPHLLQSTTVSNPQLHSLLQRTTYSVGVSWCVKNSLTDIHTDTQDLCSQKSLLCCYARPQECLQMWRFVSDSDVYHLPWYLTRPRQEFWLEV